MAGARVEIEDWVFEFNLAQTRGLLLKKLPVNLTDELNVKRPGQNDHVVEAVIGEVGLSGELRAVAHLDRRIAEAQKLGFETAIVPKAGRLSVGDRKMQIRRCETLRDALAVLAPKKAAPNSDPTP